jgi:hypothetical protein
VLAWVSGRENLKTAWCTSEGFDDHSEREHGFLRFTDQISFHVLEI